MSLVLTIDPGLVEWAYIMYRDGKIAERQTIKYKGKRTQEDRLYNIFSLLDETIERYEKESLHIVTERQFVDTMQRITGVLGALAGKNAATTTLMTPSQWKKLTTGKGNIPEEDLKAKMINAFPELETASLHEIDCAGLYLAYIAKEKMESENVEVVKKSKAKPKPHKSNVDG